MNILAVGPHPDDIECYAGGTLALFAREGHRLYNAVITNGNMGSMEYTPSELARKREQEARNAAAEIGAQVIWAGEEDASLSDTIRLRNIFIDIIRESNPDIIICPSPADYHPDHRICSLMSRDAALLCSVPLIETNHKAVTKSPHIYFWDHFNGLEFSPEEYVDITDVFETKIKMMYCHESQVSWLKSQYDMEFKNNFEIMAQFRGLACGAKYAEGFRLHRTFPGTPSERLLP